MASSAWRRYVLGAGLVGLTPAPTGSSCGMGVSEFRLVKQNLHPAGARQAATRTPALVLQRHPSTSSAWARPSSASVWRRSCQRSLPRSVSSTTGPPGLGAAQQSLQRAGVADAARCGEPCVRGSSTHAASRPPPATQRPAAPFRPGPAGWRAGRVSDGAGASTMAAGDGGRRPGQAIASPTLASTAAPVHARAEPPAACANAPAAARSSAAASRRSLKTMLVQAPVQGAARDSPSASRRGAEIALRLRHRGKHRGAFPARPASARAPRSTRTPACRPPPAAPSEAPRGRWRSGARCPSGLGDEVERAAAQRLHGQVDVGVRGPITTTTGGWALACTSANRRRPLRTVGAARAEVQVPAAATRAATRPAPRQVRPVAAGRWDPGPTRRCSSSCAARPTSGSSSRTRMGKFGHGRQCRSLAGARGRGVSGCGQPSLPRRPAPSQCTP